MVLAGRGGGAVYAQGELAVVPRLGVARRRGEHRSRCPTMGVWSTGDQFLDEAQMIRSDDFVSGPWRYERLCCDHWVPVHAADELGHLLLEFLS